MIEKIKCFFDREKFIHELIKENKNLRKSIEILQQKLMNSKDNQ